MTERALLRVVVSAGCATCLRAAELVEALRGLRPWQPVEVLDLDAPGARRPDGVVGTPTFLLGDRIISLGNPTIDALLDTLDIADCGSA